ncbi:MAG: hypothetical protein GVY30_08510 [Chloroflexi bacterium]|jgi:formaldehyde-activating enzyme involved in methanogenesis|nr:hypothetical protein [Chloroflexota bacterium]
MFKKKWMLGSIMGGLALVLAVAGVGLFGETNIVSAARSNMPFNQGGPGDGPGFPGGRGFPGGDIDINPMELLAEALDISVEELEAAQETAFEAGIEQAVDEGLITREQADQMLVWGGGRGQMRGQAGGIDKEALLAEALGITTDELQAAREEAHEAAIAQAVDEGIITQEQADEMARRRTLREDYLNREALLAEALGMTVEELEDARAEGQTLTDLLEAQGLEATTVHDNLEAAFEAALARAVADGILTQDEADKMQGGFGRGGMMAPGAGMRGRGIQRPGCGRGRGGRRGRGGQMPGAPGAGDDTDTGFGPRGGFAPPIEGSDL